MLCYNKLEHAYTFLSPKEYEHLAPLIKETSIRYAARKAGYRREVVTWIVAKWQKYLALYLIHLLRPMKTILQVIGNNWPYGMLHNASIHVMHVFHNWLPRRLLYGLKR